MSAQPKTPAAIRRTQQIWQSAESWIAVLAFSAIGLLIFADVAFREFMGPVTHFFGLEISLPDWIQARSLTLCLLVFGVFAGLGLSVAQGRQLAPGIRVGKVTKAGQGVLNRWRNALSCLLLLGVTAYSVEFVLSSRDTGLLITGLDVPAWVVQSVIPMGFLSAAIRYGVYAVWPSAAPKPASHPE